MTGEELATLACASAFDAPSSIHGAGYPCGTIDGSKLVCCDAGGVFVLELATGTVLRHIPIANASEIRCREDGYVVTVRDRSSTSGGRLVHLPFDDSPPRVAPYRGWVKTWSSSTSQLALFGEGRLEVLQWPSMDVVHVVEGFYPTIDWSSRLMMVSDAERSRHIIDSMDGDHARRYVDYEDGEPQHFYTLGQGVVEIDHGFTMLSVIDGWRTKLYPSPPAASSLALHRTPDGHGIRTVMENRPIRFDFDFATGAILTPLPTVAGGHDPFLQELWHPLVDAVVLEDTDGNEALYDLDDELLVELPPGAQAKQWFDGGRALLLTFPSTDESKPLRIEVWRVR